MKTRTLILGMAALLPLFTGCAAFEQALTQPYQQTYYQQPGYITPNAYGVREFLPVALLQEPGPREPDVGVA